MGPMIYAMVIVKGEDSQMLSDAGHADSKKLNSSQREALANRLTAAARGESDLNTDNPHPLVGWVTVISHAAQIDHLLLQNKKVHTQLDRRRIHCFTIGNCYSFL